jgi:hypothetical protein
MPAFVLVIFGEALLFGIHRSEPIVTRGLMSRFFSMGACPPSLSF